MILKNQKRKTIIINIRSFNNDYSEKRFVEKIKFVYVGY